MPWETPARRTTSSTRAAWKPCSASAGTAASSRRARVARPWRRRFVSPDAATPASAAVSLVFVGRRAATTRSWSHDARRHRPRGRRAVGRCYLSGRPGRVVPQLPPNWTGSPTRSPSAWPIEGWARATWWPCACRPRPDHVVAYAACAKLGAITAGVNPRLTEARARRRAGPGRSRRWCSDAELAGRATSTRCWRPAAGGLRRPGATPPPLDADPDRPVALVFTSGTTGLPKGGRLRRAPARLHHPGRHGRSLGRRRSRPGRHQPGPPGPDHQAARQPDARRHDLPGRALAGGRRPAPDRRASACRRSAASPPSWR